MKAIPIVSPELNSNPNPCLYNSKSTRQVSIKCIVDDSSGSLSEGKKKKKEIWKSKSKRYLRQMVIKKNKQN